jgi:predicted nucleotidyltransferase
MPSRPSHNLTDIVLALADAGVEFILVGGLAAVAQGASVTTFDVDIVHSRADENVEKLLAVLTGLDAYYRGRPGGERLGPDRRALSGPGHSLFMTSLGPLDVLGEIEGHRSYAELIDHTESVAIFGRTVRVLSLEMIVRLKRASTHPKDVQALPILEAALERAKP